MLERVECSGFIIKHWDAPYDRGSSYQGRDETYETNPPRF